MRRATSPIAATSGLPYELRMASGASASISDGSSTRQSENGSSTDRRSRKTLPYGSTTGIATSSATAIRRQTCARAGLGPTPRWGERPPPIGGSVVDGRDAEEGLELPGHGKRALEFDFTAAVSLPDTKR